MSLFVICTSGARISTGRPSTARFCARFAISWKATLAGLLAGLAIVGISHFFVRMAQRAGKRQTTLLASLVTRLTDTLQSVKPLKSMAREHLTDAVLAMETSRLNQALPPRS